MQLYVQQACPEQRRYCIYYLETDEKVNQQLLDNQMNRTLLYFKPTFPSALTSPNCGEHHGTMTHLINCRIMANKLI